MRAILTSRIDGLSTHRRGGAAAMTRGGNSDKPFEPWWQRRVNQAPRLSMRLGGGSGLFYEPQPVCLTAPALCALRSENRLP